MRGSSVTEMFCMPGSSLIIKKPENSRIPRSSVSYNTFSAAFWCWEILHYCKFNTGMMITFQNMGRLQKKFEGSLWHWLSLSVLSRAPLSDKPMTSLDFVFSKSKLCDLKNFPFPPCFLHWQCKVGSNVWGVHVEPQGCHLPGDVRVESNCYICKNLKFKKIDNTCTWKNS